MNLPAELRSLTLRLGVLFLLWTASLPAQLPDPVRASPADWPRPTASAVRIEEPPVLDGEVLGEAVWATALPATGFFQNRPDEGRPASERTEVRILYTRETLYFGVVCFDRDPGSIVVTEGRRDSPLGDTDSIQIILDTYLDGQNGFLFATNPAGIQYDAQIANEGEGSNVQRWATSAGQSGSGAGFNLNWDASWEVKTRISEIGWSAEFAIPFRTLRHPGGDHQKWGLNFQRTIRRRNESSYWAPVPRQYNLFRVSLAGTLEEIEVARQSNLKLMPYLLGELRDRVSLTKKQWLGEVGADLKYSLTPSLTLDLTYNTDFAQVEVDEQQINLDRFNLFFPEKRPFFLENAGLFSVGVPREVDLFFSRRIGIGPGGVPIPVLGGARLTGKVAGTEVGFLDMQTREVGGSIQGNNYAVGRIRHEFPNRSYLGGMFVNRQGTGDLAPGRDHNRSFALDGQLGIGESGQISGFAAGTRSPDLESGHAFRLAGRINSQAWRIETSFTEVSENFNPEVGFLQRNNFRKPALSVFHFHRPRDFWGLLELRPHFSYQSFWNFDGLEETRRIHAGSHWEWKNGWGAETGMNFNREGVVEPFEIVPGVTVPPGTYDHVEARWIVNSNMSARASFRLTLLHGSFFGGDRVAWTPQLKVRLRETFSADLNWEINEVSLPGGDFTSSLGRFRLSYAFSPAVFLQGLIQYNNQSDLWSMNLRFGWLQAANTGLFVVYNDTRGVESRRSQISDRSLQVKFSWLLDLLD